MSRTKNARYRIARNREEAIDFVNSIFDGKLMDSEYPEVLFLASDLKMRLGETSTEKSIVVAEIPGRTEHLWEPDPQGHWISNRDETINYRILLPKLKPGEVT